MATDRNTSGQSMEHSFTHGEMKDASKGDVSNKHPERKTLIIKDNKEKTLALKIRWFVYTSHFLSAWGDRMWQFGVGLFMVIIAPDSLLLTAVYGFAMGGAVLLFGTLVGDWIDRTPRLRAARITLLLQNLSVVACSIVLYFVITYRPEIESYWPDSGLLTLFYGVIIAIAIVSNLASTGTTIAVERDWIVEICDKDTDLLAATSAKLKGIDLITNIVAPIATGQIMYFTSENIGALFIGGWNLVSVVVEYYLLWKVHDLVPRLKDKTYRTTKQADAVHDDDQGPSRCDACTRSVFSGFLILGKGWRTYVKYNVAFAGLGLAFLYMTVLGFDNITVGFAYTQGVNESIMGALMAAGALFGILGTIIYPRVRKKIGLVRTGLYGLFSQVMLLSLCVLSVWAPGSPFNPYIRSRNPGTNTAIESNSSLVAINSTIFNYTNASYNRNDVNGAFPVDIDSNVSSFDVRGADLPNLLINNSVPETDAVINSTESADTGWKNYISVGLLMLGIIGARCGLWMTDLSINQLFLESVEDTERGIVLGVQTSLNQLMDMLKFVMVMAAPEPELFGILVVISFVFVTIGWALYAKFSLSVRKHLFHFEKILVCGPKKGYQTLE